MDRDRLLHGALLAGLLAPLATDLWFGAVLLGWPLTVGALLVAAREPRRRRAALAGVSVSIVGGVVGLAGLGVTLGGIGVGAGGDQAALGALALVLSFWTPAGIFVAFAASDRPARVAAFGLATTAVAVVIVGADVAWGRWGGETGSVDWVLYPLAAGIALVHLALMWRLVRTAPADGSRPPLTA